ncbi:MAG: Stf0 family sulfotransferase [Paracoccaceae bacterium]
MSQDCAAYVICTAPRSGSTLLCNLLAATGVAGNPDSHFHEPSLAGWLEAYGLTPRPGAGEREVLEAVFAAARAEGSRGGMFGLRMQRHSFDFFAGRLAVLFPDRAGDRARIEAAFGPVRFIHLSRGDKVEQAVSFVRARQTGLWHAAPDGSELERLSPPAEPRYDARAIAVEVEALTAQDRAWQDWFAREAIAPMRLGYDALAADPGAALRRVLGFLGRDPAAAEGVVPGVAKLSDALSRDWVARFRAERGGG